MGCEQSATAALKVQDGKPKFAIEKYKEKQHPNLLQAQRQARLTSKARRKPVLKVPEKVIAPSVVLTDVGCNAYRSMHSSPKMTHTLSRSRKDALGHMPIDDIDEPPNHETYAEYIMHLDTFMWDVKCNPDRLSRRVTEARNRMDMKSVDEIDEGYADIAVERTTK
jgi:hypothetical protein